MTEPQETCEICPHPAGDHILVATDPVNADPTKGGVRLCPVKRCTCYATWSLENVSRETVREPGNKELRAIRKVLQQ